MQKLILLFVFLAASPAFADDACSFGLLTETCSGCLPLSGGTVSGNVAVTGTLTVTGASYANGGIDMSSAVALPIGATHATSVAITPATNIVGNLSVNTSTMTVNASTGDTAVAAGGSYGFAGRSKIVSTADGQTDVENAAATGALRMYTSTTAFGIEPPNPTADASTRSLYVRAENVPANATAARTAGNLYLGGGIDSKTIVFDDATNPDTSGHCPGTTTTLSINGTANVLAYNTYCAGGCTTQAAACTALAGAINNLTGVTATCGTITGGLSNAVLVTPIQPTTYSVWFTAEAAACTTYSNGTDGTVVVNSHSYTTNAPSITSERDLTTGIIFSGSSAGFVANNTAQFYCLNGGCFALTIVQASSDVAIIPGYLAAGTMTVTNATYSYLRTVINRYSWTNAMVTALGANLTGDISVAVIPAKVIVKNVFVVIDTACTGTATLTVAVGRTGAGYIDYIVASNAKAAANTVYGAVAGDRGTNLTGYDLASWTGTTTIYAHFISTTQTLDATTTCTGHVDIETELLP